MLQRLHLAFSPSRRCFALVVGAHTLRVWWLDESLGPEGATQEVAYALEMDTGRMGIVGVSFLDDARLVVAHGDGSVQGWGLTPAGGGSDPSMTSEHSDVFPERRPDLEVVGEFKRSGEDPVERASPSLRATLRWVLDLGARLESCAFTRTEWGVRCVTGATDGRVMLVDLAPGVAPRATLLGRHDTAVVLSALAGDGGRFATASRDRKLGVWRPDELVAPRGDGGAWRVLDESGGEVWAMCFSPSARYMVSGGIDNGVYFWDLKAERALRAESHDHEGWIASLAWSDDERVIASASWDKTIGLFQAGDLKPLYCFEYHTDYVSQVMFVPGTNLLVSSSYDKTVAVWDWRNAELIKVFKGHEDWIQALVWLGDGLFCSASSDRTVRIWSLDTMSEVATLGEGGADDWLSSSLGSSFGLGGLGGVPERSSGFGSRRRVRATERSGPADEVLASLAQVEQHELGDDVSSFIEDEVMVLAAMASERASERSDEADEGSSDQLFELPATLNPRPVTFNDDSDVDDAEEATIEALSEVGGDVFDDEVSAASVSEDALLIEQALERLSFASDGEHMAAEDAARETSGPVTGVDASESTDDPTQEFSLADVARNMNRMKSLESGEWSSEPDEVPPEMVPDPASGPVAQEAGQTLVPLLALPLGASPEAVEAEVLPELDPDLVAEEEPEGEGVGEVESPPDADSVVEDAPVIADLEDDVHERVTSEGDAFDRSSVPEADESSADVGEFDLVDLEELDDVEVEELPAPPPVPSTLKLRKLPRPSVVSIASIASSASDEVSEELPDPLPEVADEAGSFSERPSSGLHMAPPDALQSRYEVEGLGDRISSSVEEDGGAVIEPSLATIDSDRRGRPQALMSDGPSSLSEPLDSEVEPEPVDGPLAPEPPVEEPEAPEVESIVDPEADAEPASEPEPEAVATEDDLEPNGGGEDPPGTEAVEDVLGQLSDSESSSVEEIAADMSAWNDVGSRLHVQASKMELASVVTDLDRVDLGALAGPRLDAAEITLDHGVSEVHQELRQGFLIDREPTRRFQQPVQDESPIEPPGQEDSEVLRPRQTTREQVRAKLKERFASGKLSRLRHNLDGEFEEGAPPERGVVEASSAESALDVPPTIAEHSPFFTAPEPTIPESAPEPELEPPVLEPVLALEPPTPELEVSEGAIPVQVQVVKISASKTPSFVSATHIERVATAELYIDEMESEFDAVLPSDGADMSGPMVDLEDVSPPDAIMSDPAVGHDATESERVEYEPTEAEPPAPGDRPAVGVESQGRPKAAATVERAAGSRKQPSREELDVAFANLSPTTAGVTSAPTPFPGEGRGDLGQSGSPMAKFLSPNEVVGHARPEANEPNIHGTVMGFGSLFKPGGDSSAVPLTPTLQDENPGRELFDVTIAEIWQLRLGQRRAAMKIFKKRATPVTTFRSWERLEPEVGEVYGIGIGGEIDYFAVCGARTRVDVWAGGERAFSLETQATATLQSLTISQDGRVVISGDEEGGVHLWLLPADPISDRKASIGHATMSGHTGPVSSIALSSTGKMMVTGSLDGTARLWDMVNGSCIAVLTRHRGPVTGVTFTSKGPVTISRDGSLRLWDKRGVLLSEAEGLGDLNAICSRKSKVYVGNGKGEVHFFQRGVVAKVFDVGEPIVSMAMSVEDVGVIGTRKGKVHVFEWGKSEILQVLQVGEDVSSVGATEKELLVGTVTGAVEVYRQPNRQ